MSNSNILSRNTKSLDYAEVEILRKSLSAYQCKNAEKFILAFKHQFFWKQILSNMLPI